LRLHEPAGSFDVSWTGKEPLPAYTDRVKQEGSWFVPAMWSVLLAPAATAAIYFPLRGDRTEGEGQASENWSGSLGFGYFVAVVTVFSDVYAIAYAYRDARSERLHRNRTGWTLHVGPHYILATGATGRREFPWDQVQRVTIEEIRGPTPRLSGAPYLCTGVHLQPARGASRPKKKLPAGWPYQQSGTITVRGDRRFPVCLGLMTEQQRTELTEALARYGGKRWKLLAV